MQRFTTTDRNNVERGDYYESRALALAFAVIGRLIAEEFLVVDFNKPEWEVEHRHIVQAVADVIHTYETSA